MQDGQVSWEKKSQSCSDCTFNEEPLDTVTFAQTSLGTGWQNTNGKCTTMQLLHYLKKETNEALLRFPYLKIQWLLRSKFCVDSSIFFRTIYCQKGEFCHLLSFVFAVSLFWPSGETQHPFPLN